MLPGSQTVNISRVKDCAEVPLRFTLQFPPSCKTASKMDQTQVLLFPSIKDIQSVIVRSELFDWSDDHHRGSFPEAKTFFSLSLQTFRVFLLILWCYTTGDNGYDLFTDSKFSNISHF